MAPTGVKTRASSWQSPIIGDGTVDRLSARRWRKPIEIGIAIEIEIRGIRGFDNESVFDPDFDFDLEMLMLRCKNLTHL